MLKIKVNGQLKTLPERWEEVSFEQFVKLSEAVNDQAKVLSALFDMPESEVKGAKIQGFDFVMSHLQFLNKTFEIDPAPKKIGQYDLIQTIENSSVEQYQECLAEIQKNVGLSPSEQVKALPFYAAVYITDPFDSEKARYKAEEIKKLPCTEVMAAGAFFQAKCLSIASGLPMNYLTRHLPMKRNRLGLRGFRRRLASTKLWIASRVMWAKMTRSF